MSHQGSGTFRSHQCILCGSVSNLQRRRLFEAEADGSPTNAGAYKPFRGPNSNTFIGWAAKQCGIVRDHAVQRPWRRGENAQVAM